MGVSNLINTSESGTKHRTTSKQVLEFRKEVNMSKLCWSTLIGSVVLATALLSSAHPALQTPPQGQEKMGATSNSESHLQMLSEKLNLTEHQKAKLKPIL